MIEPNIYCKVSGMVMRCISTLNDEGRPLPTVLEIGCADGQGLSRYAGFCRSVVAIDPMVHGRPDLLSVERERMDVDHDKLDAFQARTKGYNVTLVLGCSLWPDVIRQVGEALPDGADIVVIDGCHHPYEAVWADVAAYQRFVRPRGFIVMDDLYEDDIERAWDRALTELDVFQFDRKRWDDPGILQECGALRLL